VEIENRVHRAGQVADDGNQLCLRCGTLLAKPGDEAFAEDAFVLESYADTGTGRVQTEMIEVDAFRAGSNRMCDEEHHPLVEREILGDVYGEQ
jgi:hypothetical protein